MAFALDASVAVVPSQATNYAKRVRVRARREPFHVPTVFTAEGTNVPSLWNAVAF
ncbi:MAG: hypothetical protein ACREVG_01950 [Burkholderiales bacterium]